MNQLFFVKGLLVVDGSIEKRTNRQREPSRNDGLVTIAQR